MTYKITQTDLTVAFHQQLGFWVTNHISALGNVTRQLPIIKLNDSFHNTALMVGFISETVETIAPKWVEKQKSKMVGAFGKSHAIPNINVNNISKGAAIPLYLLGLTYDFFKQQNKNDTVKLNNMLKADYASVQSLYQKKLQQFATKFFGMPQGIQMFNRLYDYFQHGTYINSAQAVSKMGTLIQKAGVIETDQTNIENRVKAMIYPISAKLLDLYYGRSRTMSRSILYYALSENKVAMRDLMGAITRPVKKYHNKRIIMDYNYKVWHQNDETTYRWLVANINRLMTYRDDVYNWGATNYESYDKTYAVMTDRSNAFPTNQIQIGAGTVINALKAAEQKTGLIGWKM